jgi:hypothetical protein
MNLELRRHSEIPLELKQRFNSKQRKKALNVVNLHILHYRKITDFIPISSGFEKYSLDLTLFCGPPKPLS